MTEQEAIKLVVSFSGGETSAMMSYILKNNNRYDCNFVFANTGAEDERTLKFVDECDKRFGLGVVWLEAVVHPEKGVGSTYSVVNYETASRNAEPFEEVIKKYGIPSNARPLCTNELKRTPIKKWQKDQGLGLNSIAIGIRADEIDRISINAKKQKIIYPLIKLGIRKREVKEFWAKQDFNLGINEHEGNCVWCYKKSDRKLFTLILDRPEIFDFPKRMEKEYGRIAAKQEGLGHKFWRNNRSTDEMFEQADRTIFDRFTEPDWLAQGELDLGGGCGESCEVWSDE